MSLTDQDIRYLLDEFTLLQTVTAVLVSIASVSMALRMYVRAVMAKSIGPDDWSMVIAMTLYLASAICIIVLVVTGRPMVLAQDWSIDRVRFWFRLYKSTYTTWSLGLIATKLSIGFFFVRILGHLPFRRVAIWLLVALTALLGVVYCALITFTCIDIAAGDPTSPKCSIQHVGAGFLAAYSGANIVADLVLTVMGVHAICSARLNAATKAVASLLVALGCTGAVASAVRLSVTLAPATPLGYVPQLFASARWCQIELSTAVIASNLAMTRPLFQLALVRLGLADRSSVGVATSRPPSSIRPGMSSVEAAHGRHARPQTPARSSVRPPTPSSRVGGDGDGLLDSERRARSRNGGLATHWYDDDDKSGFGGRTKYSVTVESVAVRHDRR